MLVAWEYRDRQNTEELVAEGIDDRMQGEQRKEIEAYEKKIKRKYRKEIFY